MPPTPHPVPVRRLPLPAAPPRPAPVVDYPDVDGEPMTPEHRLATTDCTQPLEDRYAPRADVYVGSNMTMYCLEGNDELSVSPDVFVAFGPARDKPRRVWLAWEEGKLADFVLEVASKGTYRKDEGRKRRIYERHGVTEYWQFDPTGDYLDPVLQGRRLNASGSYELLPLASTSEGLLYGESRVLGLHPCLDGHRLRLFDPATGEFLATNRDKDETIAERDRALAEERRARKALEAELEVLKRGHRAPGC